MMQNGMMGPGMMGYGYLGLGWLFQILILVLFFLVIWWMFRNSSSFGFKANESALDILKKRLASGEIDTKEFERLKKEIES
ncbi:SHOCT domain-containing protein [Candidatus Woesearchaeota archaeon]|nr:SHOCT domain-containing protein [Candidatus Woesearchaeota archaeon]